MPHTTIRVDEDTRERLKRIAGDVPVASWLRQHSLKLEAESKPKDVWQQIFEHTFKLDVSDESQLNEFVKNTSFLLITAIAIENGIDPKAALKPIYNEAIEKVKSIHYMDEMLKSLLIKQLEDDRDKQSEAAWTRLHNRPEYERRIKAMTNGLLDRYIYEHEDRAIRILAINMQANPPEDNAIMKEVLQERVNQMQEVAEKLKGLDYEA